MQHIALNTPDIISAVSGPGAAPLRDLSQGVMPHGWSPRVVANSTLGPKGQSGAGPRAPLGTMQWGSVELHLNTSCPHVPNPKLLVCRSPT